MIIKASIVKINDKSWYVFTKSDGERALVSSDKLLFLESNFLRDMPVPEDNNCVLYDDKKYVSANYLVSVRKDLAGLILQLEKIIIQKIELYEMGFKN